MKPAENDLSVFRLRSCIYVGEKVNVEYEDVHFPPLGLRSLSRPAICSCDHWHYWFFIFLVIVQCVSNAWVMLLYISSLWAPLFVFRQCVPPHSDVLFTPLVLSVDPRFAAEDLINQGNTNSSTLFFSVAQSHTHTQASGHQSPIPQPAYEVSNQLIRCQS